MDERLSFALRPDGERESRKIVALDDAQDFELEAAVGAFGAGFLKEDRHGDGETVGAVAAGVLAGHAVKPALPAAGDGEVRGIDGKHSAVLRHASVKPVGDGERDAPALFGLGVDEVVPLVDPAEHRGFLAALARVCSW